MLSNAPAFSSFSVDDLERARRFYGETLGLDVEEAPQGLRLGLAGGGHVFVYAKGAAHAPAGFTVLNFQVDDIEQAVERLRTAGVTFERYEGELATDEQGIFRGGGPPIAWFADPAGNVLSVLEAR
jgi:catechol 2,3-dioxygenase-like lactoylglutathione lyase family enzyme